MNAPHTSRGAEKVYLQAAQKDLRGEAREKSTSGGVPSQYVGARQLSATKHMSLFQQPAMRKKRPSLTVGRASNGEFWTTLLTLNLKLHPAIHSPRPSGFLADQRFSFSQAGGGHSSGIHTQGRKLFPDGFRAPHSQLLIVLAASDVICMTLDRNCDISLLFKPLGGKVDFSLAEFRELRGVKAESYIGEDHTLDLDNFGHFFNDFFDNNFLDGHLNNLNYLLGGLWRCRHLCGRHRLLQRGSGCDSIIGVWPRAGDNRRVGFVTEKSLLRLRVTNQEMKGPKNGPL